jgi:hypothetical protein
LYVQLTAVADLMLRWTPLMLALKGVIVRLPSFVV